MQPIAKLGLLHRFGAWPVTHWSKAKLAVLIAPREGEYEKHTRETATHQ